MHINVDKETEQGSHSSRQHTPLDRLFTSKLATREADSPVADRLCSRLSAIQRQPAAPAGTGILIKHLYAPHLPLCCVPH